MAQVTLTIGGRAYDLACRDGEEDHLLALSAIVDSRVSDAGRAVGGGNEARQLVMAALLLADELSDLRAGAPDPLRAELVHGIGALAERIETLAQRLENEGETT
jgi:cell division protein ZapA